MDGREGRGGGGNGLSASFGPRDGGFIIWALLEPELPEEATLRGPGV